MLYLFLPNSPVNARLLTHRQRRIAVERLRNNQTGIENKTFKMYQVKEAFLDYKLYMFFLLVRGFCFAIRHLIPMPIVLATSPGGMLDLWGTLADIF